MFQPQTLTENLMYTVGRVEAYGPSGVEYGTAFQFNVVPPNAPPGMILPFLVTNKHVVGTAQRIRFLLHTRHDGKPDGQSVFIDRIVDGDLTFQHPTVDLIAVAVGSVLQKWKHDNPGRDLFWNGFDKSFIVPEATLSDLDVPSSVLMVGCPSGMWDEANGFPLFRRGSTATHPAIDFDGKPEFIVDIAVFSGSSGSPVLLHDVGLLPVKKSDPGMFGPVNRIGLLGILYAGPRIDERGKVIKEPVPTKIGDEVAVATRMHLGNVIKGRELNFMAEELERIIAANPPALP